MNPANCPNLSDVELVSQTLAHRELFLCLASRYEDRLLRYIKRLGSFSAADAADILQESFLKMYLNLNSFDPSLKFSSWAYRITHNEAISYLRKHRRSAVVRPLSDNDLTKLSADTNLEHEFDLVLNRADLEAALARLDLKYREVIILKFLEDKSYEEISDILKKPPGTIATLISRAKQKLRQLLPS